MPKILYVEKRFGARSLEIIDQANRIIEEYQAQGYILTLRQLYYQFVSRDLIPNQQKEYKRLGSIINDGRLAGLIDWNSIEDRTRNLQALSHWSSPIEIVQSCAKQYKIDMWANQNYRPEVWIEKDALIGVIEGPCEKWDVPFMSCRGYTSQSEAWNAGRRMRISARKGQKPFLIHLGDHDPSGIDMTRDIGDRLEMFMGGTELRRIALNMDQVEEKGPPPNPAKLTDSRCAGYIARFGDESWELDALEPAYIGELIEAVFTELVDSQRWEESVKERDEAREQLSAVANQWEDVVEGFA